MANRLQRLQAIGALANTSTKVLHALGDAEYWLAVIRKLEQDGDWDKVAALLQFHQQMRDGRPHQQINVTATNIHVSAEQIARARAVVRELSPSIRGELKAKGDEPNAAEGQGGKKDGSV